MVELAFARFKINADDGARFLEHQRRKWDIGGILVLAPPSIINPALANHHVSPQCLAAPDLCFPRQQPHLNLALKTRPRVVFCSCNTRNSSADGIAIATMAILDLPDELLLEIFNPLFVLPRLTQRDKPTAHPAAAVVRVCRRFNHVATPRLYRHLRVVISDQSPDRARLLLRTLSENPSFGPYCRVLQLGLPDPGAGPFDEHGMPGPLDEESIAELCAAFEVAVNIVIRLRNTTELLVNAYFTSSYMNDADPAMGVVLGAARHMPKLEKLSLGPQVYIHQVCEAFEKISQLRTLEVKILAAPNTLHYTESIPIPPQEKFGCSSVTNLEIDYMLVSPRNLVSLLLYPAKLEHFAFNGMSPGCYWPWPLQDLLTAVEPHKGSLRTLRVAVGLVARATVNDGDSDEGNDVNDQSLQEQVENLDLASFTQLGGITFVDPPA